MGDVVIEGNTHYYVSIAGYDQIFDVDMSNGEFPEFIKYKVGDTVTFEMIPGAGLVTVTKIK